MDFFRAGPEADGQGSRMTKGLGAWLLGYGFILFACGAAAYLANPTFQLLLVAGAVTGGLMAALGVVSIQGAKWVPRAASMLTLIFMMAGLALVMQYGLKVIKESTGLVEGIISLVVFFASATALWRLKKEKA